MTVTEVTNFSGGMMGMPGGMNGGTMEGLDGILGG